MAYTIYISIWVRSSDANKEDKVILLFLLLPLLILILTTTIKVIDIFNSMLEANIKVLLPSLLLLLLLIIIILILSLMLLHILLC